MYSATDGAALPAPGFPIRKSAGQRLFSASPRLIAAVHVLLRLLVPRHPPCALTILTVSSIHARRREWGEYPFGLLVQFSSSAEAAWTEDFRPTRPLKTEQRSPGGSRPPGAGPVDILRRRGAPPPWDIGRKLRPASQGNTVCMSP
jgi:hypothetical protein